MYVLQVTDSNPPLYIGASNGFFDKTDTVSQALQFNRLQDASAIAEIVVDSTTPAQQ